MTCLPITAIVSVMSRDNGKSTKKLGSSALAAVGGLTLLLTACGSSSKSGSTATTGSSGGAAGPTASPAAAPTTAAQASATKVHIGYFPNLTHAAALVGVASGIFAKDMGPDTLDAGQVFTAEDWGG